MKQFIQAFTTASLKRDPIEDLIAKGSSDAGIALGI